MPQNPFITLTLQLWIRNAQHEGMYAIKTFSLRSFGLQYKKDENKHNACQYHFEFCQRVLCCGGGRKKRTEIDIQPVPRDRNRNSGRFNKLKMYECT